MKVKNLSFLGYSNYEITSNGDVINIKTGRVLSQFLCGLKRAQYYCVKLYSKDSSKTFKVHRLIAEAFISEIPDGMCVNHIDGNKLNNSLNNLEIVTYSQNTQHARDVGLYIKNLTNDKVIDVCTLICDGYRLVDVSEMTGVSYTTVTDIFRGWSYRTLTERFDLKAIKREDRLSIAKVEDICEKLQSLVDIESISLGCNCKEHIILSIKNRKLYCKTSNKFKW
jgi:hypothetical protein